METLLSELNRLITLNDAINSNNAWIALYRSKPDFQVSVSSHRFARLLEQANITYIVAANELEAELSAEESTTQHK